MAEFLLTTGLQPIVPPTAPSSEAPVGDVGAVWIISTGLLLVFTGLLFNRCARRWRVRHRLQRIKRNVRDNKTNAEATAYQIALLLRWHFSFKRLEGDNPPTGIPAQDWFDLVEQLEILRYHPRASTDATVFEPMFATLKRWFRC